MKVHEKTEWTFPNCKNAFSTAVSETVVERNIVIKTTYLLPLPLVRGASGIILKVWSALENIPKNALWINRLFIKLVNKSEKNCLTIYCSGINPNGPGRFRTKADNPVSQTCYFNVQDDEELFNVFISKRINNDSTEDKVLLKIEYVKTEANNEPFDAKLELEN